MSKTLDDLFQEAVNKPQYQLVEEARGALVVVGKYLQMFTGQVQSAITLMAAVGTFVAADGKLTSAEYQFAQSVLHSDISYDEFFSSGQAAIDTNTDETIDSLIDKAPDEVKAAFLMLCMAFIACDGTITPEEKALFVKYLV